MYSSINVVAILRIFYAYLASVFVQKSSFHRSLQPRHCGTPWRRELGCWTPRRSGTLVYLVTILLSYCFQVNVSDFEICLSGSIASTKKFESFLVQFSSRESLIALCDDVKAQITMLCKFWWRWIISSFSGMDRLIFLSLPLKSNGQFRPILCTLTQDWPICPEVVKSLSQLQASRRLRSWEVACMVQCRDVNVCCGAELWHAVWPKIMVFYTYIYNALDLVVFGKCYELLLSFIVFSHAALQQAPLLQLVSSEARAPTSICRLGAN